MLELGFPVNSQIKIKLMPFGKNTFSREGKQYFNCHFVALIILDALSIALTFLHLSLSPFLKINLESNHVPLKSISNAKVLV